MYHHSFFLRLRAIPSLGIARTEQAIIRHFILIRKQNKNSAEREWEITIFAFTFEVAGKDNIVTNHLETKIFLVWFFCQTGE
jgi:hypothetical protein